MDKVELNIRFHVKKCHFGQKRTTGPQLLNLFITPILIQKTFKKQLIMDAGE
jgi:hypothetical protein